MKKKLEEKKKLKVGLVVEEVVKRSSTLTLNKGVGREG
jgi:hypothetical protein